jgi:C4-dicarboxylate-specific signal transduction histidine kinase
MRLITLLTLTLRVREDVVRARQRARQISGLLGFEGQDQIRIATAVSEIARNAYSYAGRAKIEYVVIKQPLLSMGIRVSDKGPGIENLTDLLAGKLISDKGGKGILGARHIMDRLDITSAPASGTTVWMEMKLPKSVLPPTSQSIAQIIDALVQHSLDTTTDEVQQQNQDLLHALELLKQARNELEERVQTRTAELKQANLELQQEITERIKAEQSLQAISQRMNLALKSAKVGTWSWHSHHHKILLDDYLPLLLGLNQNTYTLRFKTCLSYLHAEDRRRIVKELLQAIQNKKRSYDIEFRVVWPTGHIHVLASRGEIYWNLNNKVLGITGICWDISARRQAEQELRQHQQALAQTARISSMGEMGSALAHELNQPLTAITTFTQGCIRRLAATAENGPILEAMTIVAQQAERAGEIIHRLKDYVRKGKTVQEIVSINVLIKTAIRLIHYEIRDQLFDIELAIADNLPAIMGDRIQIEQVLINLLRNALEAMRDAKTVAPLLKISAQLYNQAYLAVNVIDNGPGLPAELITKILEPYFTTKSQGIGMGLSISRTIIESHGGFLIAKKSTNGGACFQFTLPIAKQE